MGTLPPQLDRPHRPGAGHPVTTPTRTTTRTTTTHHHPEPQEMDTMTNRITWQQITERAAHLTPFNRTAHGMEAHRVEVASRTAREIGPAAEFHTLSRRTAEAAEAMTDRYANGYNRTAAYWDSTPIYWAARDGEVIAMITRNGILWTADEFHGCRVTARQAAALDHIREPLKAAAEGVRKEWQQARLDATHSARVHTDDAGTVVTVYAPGGEQVQTFSYSPSRHNYGQRAEFHRAGWIVEEEVTPTRFIIRPVE